MTLLPVYSCHLILASSGFVEISIKEIFGAYAQRHANARIRRYVERQVSYMNSFNCEKIRGLVEAFEVGWWAQIADNLPPGSTEGVDSLKALRDQVAHGRTAGVGLNVVQGYFQGATQFIERTNDVVLPA